MGRTEELARLAEACASGARLVTLVGPAGIGKTAIALRIARELTGPLGGAAPRVALAYAPDDGGAANAVARALELPVVDPDETEPAITSALGAQPGTLVLDGVDTTGSAITRLLARWLAVAPVGRFLVTARKPLDLPGEIVISVGPLGEAAELFRVRSRAASPRFDEVDGAAVERLVAALAHNPLLVELAASLLRGTSVEHVLAGVLGAHGDDDALLAWFWGHLDATEQRTLAGLSVERGTLSLELACALVGESALPSGAPLGDVLLGASGKGWVLMRLRPGESPLLLLPEKLREFAEKQLSPSERVHLETRCPQRSYGATPSPVDGRLAEGELKLAQGHLAEATARFLDLTRAKEPRTKLAATLGLALIAAERGAMPDAERHVARLSAQGAGPLLSRARAIAEMGLALGWLAQGDAVRAGERATRALDDARRGAHPMVAALAGACRAAAFAMGGELDRAEPLAVCTCPKHSDTCEPLLAHVALARARAAGDGVCAEALRVVTELRGRAETLDWSARLALRALERALHGDLPTTEAAAPEGTHRAEAQLVVAEDAAWFQVGEGGPVVTLSRRLPLRRLLAALCDAYAQTPGIAVSWRDLVAAGWPDERISADAARNRLQVALATLRAMGLRDHVERDGSGYRLTAGAVLREGGEA